MPIMSERKTFNAPTIPVPVAMRGTLDGKPICLQYIPKQKRLNTELKITPAFEFGYEVSVLTADMHNLILSKGEYAEIEMIYELASGTVVMMGKCQVVLENASVILSVLGPDQFVSTARVYPPL